MVTCSWIRSGSDVANHYECKCLADQVSGRLRRRDDKKTCYMWDIVDSDVGQLRVWSQKRADVFREKSKKFVVIDPEEL